MSASIYYDKLVEPNDSMLASDLAQSKTSLDQICDFIANEYGYLKLEWKFYNKKSGWILKLFHKKRNVLFVIPCDNYFGTAFTFGQKAFEAILSADFPEGIRKGLLEAKKYAEGRTLRMDVCDEDDLKQVLKLIQIKLAN